MEFKAEWTGGYPSLCVGEWKLCHRHEKKIGAMNPVADVSKNPMEI